MKLGLELPTKHLDLFTPLTDMDFVLAQNVLDDEDYARFYEKSSMRTGRLTILDNGFHEMGAPLPPTELIQVAERIKPNFVVAPDWFGQAKKTYEAFDAFDKLGAIKKENLSVVMQGQGESELNYFFSAVYKRVDCLCFPFRANRAGWMQTLVNSFPPSHHKWPPYIHLLGMSTWEDIEAWRVFGKRFNLMLSIDTAKPIKWGMLGEHIGYGKNVRGAEVSSATLHKAVLTDKQLSDVTWNIAYLQRFV